MQSPRKVRMLCATTWNELRSEVNADIDDQREGGWNYTSISISYSEGREGNCAAALTYRQGATT